MSAKKILKEYMEQDNFEKFNLIFTSPPFPTPNKLEKEEEEAKVYNQQGDI